MPEQLTVYDALGPRARVAALAGEGMMIDIDAIREDIECAKRSSEMARHVALDHGPELLDEIEKLRRCLVDALAGEVRATIARNELAAAIEGLRVHSTARRIELRLERDEARAAAERVRAAVANAHRFDLDSADDAAHDAFYNGVEFAHRRIRRALDGEA